jgi:hypothetical protein
MADTADSKVVDQLNKLAREQASTICQGQDPTILVGLTGQSNMLMAKLARITLMEKKLEL